MWIISALTLIVDVSNSGQRTRDAKEKQWNKRSFIYNTCWVGSPSRPENWSLLETWCPKSIKTDRAVEVSLWHATLDDYASLFYATLCLFILCILSFQSHVNAQRTSAVFISCSLSSSLLFQFLSVKVPEWETKRKNDGICLSTRAPSKLENIKPLCCISVFIFRKKAA